MRLSAVLTLTWVFLALAPCRAQEAVEDDLPPRVMSSAEIELENRKKAPPRLAITPTKLTCSLRRGETAELRLTVQNAGGQSLKWSVASAPTWVSFEEKNGVLSFGQDKTLVLVVGSKGLAPGTVRGEITLDAPGAEGSPVSVVVIAQVGGAEDPIREVDKMAKEPEPGVSGRDVSPELTPRDGQWRFGVRFGYASFGSAVEADVEPAPLIGACLSGGQLSKFLYEIGLDYTRPAAENESFDTLLLVGRLDVVFPLRDESAGARPYVLAGIRGLVEAVNDVNRGSTNFGVAVTVGAGVELGGGRFDLRATFSPLLGSDNAAGIALVSAGVRF